MRLQGQSWPEYHVSSIGRVKRVVSGMGSTPGRIRKPQPHSGGYLQMRMVVSNKAVNVYVHTMVCETFLGDQPAGSDVNHKDGNKKNNSVENLEYVSRSENVKHAIKNGLNPSRGQSHPMAKLAEHDVLSMRELKYSNPDISNGKLSDIYGVSCSQVQRIITRKLWSHI